MLADTAATLSQRFGRQVNRLLAVRSGSEAAFASGALRRTDIDHIYESTFLDLVSYFEIFIEDLFFSCILGKAALLDVKPTIEFPTRRLAEILSSGSHRGHATWSKMQDVFGRAEIFLRDGRPFTRLRSWPRSGCSEQRAQDPECHRTS